MISRFFDFYDNLIKKLLVVFMYIMLISLTIQIAGRYIDFIPRYLWTLEAVQFSLIWLVFTGSITGLRGRKHFFVDMFGDEISISFEKWIDIIYFFVLGIMTFVFIFYGYRYFVNWGLIQKSEITGMNLGLVYISVPFAGVSWLIFLAEDFYKTYFLNRTFSNRTEKEKGN
jgi:TRAP-type transport system small permease protein